MMESVILYFAKLDQRQQRIALVGAVGLVLLLIFGLVLPLERTVGAAEQRVERKRDDLAWLRSMAPQLSGLNASGPPPLRESLVVVIDRTARQSGLEKALVGSQPSGDGGLNVRLEKTSFDGLVAWLAQLRQSYGVRVESAVVEPANATGNVNASLVLHAR